MEGPVLSETLVSPKPLHGSKENMNRAKKKYVLLVSVSLGHGTLPARNAHVEDCHTNGQ